MSIKRVITKKCECLVVNWQRALCYHMQWCREANLWRSTLYNMETVFHEVPTNQPRPQIITWVWLKHYSSFFFVFSQNGLVYESYFCWRADGGIKGRSSGPAAQFALPKLLLGSLHLNHYCRAWSQATGHWENCAVSVRVALCEWWWHHHKFLLSSAWPYAAERTKFMWDTSPICKEIWLIYQSGFI